MTQVSYEAALAACRTRLGEITFENVLKDARIAELEAQITEGQQPPASLGDPSDAAFGSGQVQP